jgi:hypothetical protein
MWMGTIVTYFKELFQQLHGWTEENHKKTFWVARLHAENQIQDLSDMKQEC